MTWLDGDAIGAARERLPSWVPWARVVVLPLFAFALTWILGRSLLYRIERRAPRSAHWTERARHQGTFRVGMVVLVLFTANSSVYFAGGFYNPLCVVSSPVLICLCLLGVWIGSLSIQTTAARRIQGIRPGLRRWVRQQVTWLILFRTVYLLAIALALFTPRSTDPIVLLAMAAPLAVIVFLGLGGGVHVLRWVRLAHPLEGAAVRRAIVSSNVQPRRSLRFDVPMANAIALLWLRSIAVTERALEILDDEQLESVLRHELAHLTEGVGIRIARLGPLLLVLAVALWGPLTIWMGTRGWYLVFACLLLWTWFARRWAKQAELRADLAAASGIEVSPAYARALERLHEFNLAPAWTKRSGIHPPLYDRMLRAGVQPAFAKPAAADPAPSWFTIAIGIAIGTMYAFLAECSSFDDAGRSAEASVLRALAFGNHADVHLADLALIRFRSGHLDDSIVFYRAAASLQPGVPYAEANLAIVLARSDRCDEAKAALVEARRRASGREEKGILPKLLSDADRAVRSCLSRTGRAADR
jgi:Zn-dependent protease with chaperone function